MTVSCFSFNDCCGSRAGNIFSLSEPEHNYYCQYWTTPVSPWRIKNGCLFGKHSTGLIHTELLTYHPLSLNLENVNLLSFHFMNFADRVFMILTISSSKQSLRHNYLLCLIYWNYPPINSVWLIHPNIREELKSYPSPNNSETTSLTSPKHQKMIATLTFVIRPGAMGKESK